jgi:hypothetical protein
MPSATEAEIVAVFLNANKGTVLSTALEELGHHQTPPPLEITNKAATG